MPPNPQLSSPGWSAQNRERLEGLIRNGAGQHLPVVFDFDNTIVCGDIGEATLAMLVRDSLLTTDRVPYYLCPPVTLSSGKKLERGSLVDLTEYYEALLLSSAHGPDDPTPLAAGYIWAVEVMQGLNLLDVVCATEKVWAMSQPGQERWLDVTPGRTAYPIPFFYPESIELIAELLRYGFDVWIVSASNVWSVRWMVLRALNPLLQEHGLADGLAPDHVVGISTLLSDHQDRLCKDSVLVCELPAYATLAPDYLRSFHLTHWLQQPVPVYSGKVGAIWDAIGRRPYLCAGDSPADHPMLNFSENRLWIARLEKPDYQQATLELASQTGKDHWIIQPVRSRKAPQFVADLSCGDQ